MYRISTLLAAGRLISYKIKKEISSRVGNFGNDNFEKYSELFDYVDGLNDELIQTSSVHITETINSLEKLRVDSFKGYALMTSGIKQSDISVSVYDESDGSIKPQVKPVNLIYPLHGKEQYTTAKGLPEIKNNNFSRYKYASLSCAADVNGKPKLINGVPVPLKTDCIDLDTDYLKANIINTWEIKAVSGNLVKLRTDNPYLVPKSIPGVTTSETFVYKKDKEGNQTRNLDHIEYDLVFKYDNKFKKSAIDTNDGICMHTAYSHYTMKFSNKPKITFTTNCGGIVEDVSDSKDFHKAINRGIKDEVFDITIRNICEHNHLIPLKKDGKDVLEQAEFFDKFQTQHHHDLTRTKSSGLRNRDNVFTREDLLFTNEIVNTGGDKTSGHRIKTKGNGDLTYLEHFNGKAYVHDIKENSGNKVDRLFFYNHDKPTAIEIEKELLLEPKKYIYNGLFHKLKSQFGIDYQRDIGRTEGIDQIVSDWSKSSATVATMATIGTTAFLGAGFLLAPLVAIFGSGTFYDFVSNEPPQPDEASSPNRMVWWFFCHHNNQPTWCWPWKGSFRWENRDDRRNKNTVDSHLARHSHGIDNITILDTATANGLNPSLVLKDHYIKSLDAIKNQKSVFFNNLEKYNERQKDLIDDVSKLKIFNFVDKNKKKVVNKTAANSIDLTNVDNRHILRDVLNIHTFITGNDRDGYKMNMLNARFVPPSKLNFSTLLDKLSQTLRGIKKGLNTDKTNINADLQIPFSTPVTVGKVESTAPLRLKRRVVSYPLIYRFRNKDLTENEKK